MPANSLLNAVLDAAAHGWYAFPLTPGTKRPALHSESACPRTGPCAAGHRGWEQRATTQTELLLSAWHHAPYNIGIATGPSRLVVLDLDVPKPGESASPKTAPRGVTDGRDALAALCEDHQQPYPTNTFTVSTTSGGHHLYFAAPTEVGLRNSVGRLGWKIDTRAGGGYVVAPGSIVNGRPYTVVCDADPAPLPAWLLVLLEPPTRPRPYTPAVRPAGPGRVTAYVDAALRNETRAVANAPEGTRNQTLLRAARALGRFVADGRLSRIGVEDALREAGEVAGLQARYVDGVVTSALNWSIRNNPGACA
ncbi:bifunctional DNA primase/polymerase [Kitasatospora griseola]|uniref:bifunctional DNA primase/polymerase n=1 Tax=Kitasatospora griseola TaxID=2064 RepID=UPI0016707488|nr:bifunctional DNA primase/polymerase [Kitasatospora griseola]GGQ66176.1 hypothetical protein GCM10010195_22280 [Kitasatospora griseola]